MLEISCESCGACLQVEAHMRTAKCPYCASPSIIERPPTVDRPSPTFIVEFVVDQQRAVTLVKQWITGSGLFARSDFKRSAVDATQAVYVPAYLYGAVARTDYQASIGENYTVTETYTTTDANGKTVTRTRQVTKTEWRELYGDHECYVLDVLVTASAGIANHVLEAIEPFDLRAMRRYDPAIIAGWLAETPTLTLDVCQELARDESVVKIGEMLGPFMPGDSYSDLSYSTRLYDEVIDQLLLPVYSFAVRYHPEKAPVTILVNGQTGEIAGKVPISWVKVMVAVLGGLLGLAGLYFGLVEGGF